MNNPRVTLFVGIVGAVLVIIGALGLFATVTATGATGNVSCGSAISPDDTQARRDGNSNAIAAAMAGTPASAVSQYANQNVAACDNAIAGQRTWTWPLVGLGAIALLGIAVLRKPRPDAPKGPATA